MGFVPAERSGLTKALPALCPTGSLWSAPIVPDDWSNREGSHPSLTAKKKAPERGFFVCGGEGGIRTLEAFRLTHFPGVLLRPLGHLTGDKTAVYNPALSKAANFTQVVQQRQSLSPDFLFLYYLVLWRSIGRLGSPTILKRRHQAKHRAFDVTTRKWHGPARQENTPQGEALSLSAEGDLETKVLRTEMARMRVKQNTAGNSHLESKSRLCRLRAG
jgi:hypothetical protein